MSVFVVVRQAVRRVAGNGGTETAPERRLRSELHCLGLRFHELADPVRHALIRELFTDPAKHVRLPKVMLWPVTKGLIARFLRAA